MAPADKNGSRMWAVAPRTTPSRPLTAALETGDHHMGALRMSAASEDGIVDINSRLHSVDNLYIAGSAVFPSGGYANPTLTIVALALRLADHLIAVSGRD